MEKERFREKEPEPRVHDYSWNEDKTLHRDEVKKLLEAAPRVRRYDDVPWEQMQNAYHKVFVGACLHDQFLWLRRAPIFTVGLRLQILQPGRRSGKHDHFSEALFYILEGKGYDIHDGKRYDWEAGDLMSIPSQSVHQHFAHPDTGATLLFTAAGGLANFLGIGGGTQMELAPDFKMPEGAKPLRDPQGQLTGYRRKDGVEIPLANSGVPQKDAMEKRLTAAPLEKIQTTYDEYIQAYWEESHLRQTCLHVVKTKDLPWEDTRQGRIKYIAHPKIPTGLLTYDCFLQEIPPGGCSGKHRHVGEEVHFIIEGQGYDILDGVRWDWGKNDAVCIPVLTTHQQFNSDPKRSVLFLSLQTRLYNFIGHGGIEHFEDASS
ncbi:MAG: cupin domain-containing protein [Pseudomonadota bacterium]